MLAYLHRTSHAVLMEAIAPVSTGVMGAIDAANLRVAFSGRQTFGIVNRVMINILTMDFVRVNGFGKIERNTQFLGCTDAL